MYCEWLLKLGNSLQTPIINDFLTTMFRFGLHSYLYIIITEMKCGTTLQQHKESSLFCEKINRNQSCTYLLIPKNIIPQQGYVVKEWPSMYYTKCYQINHMERCSPKHKERGNCNTVMAEVVAQITKPRKTFKVSLPYLWCDRT